MPDRDRSAKPKSSPRKPSRKRPSPARPRPEVPSFDSALDALLRGEPSRAAALFGARALADPGDWISRANRAIALYEDGRWEEAAKAFEAEIARGGLDDLGTVPALFCLGYCRLQLGDARASLAATTAFFDLGNEQHPFYADGVENAACAVERLGHPAVADVLRARPWPRSFVILAAFEVLGIPGRPRPPRQVDWYAAGGG